MKTPKDFIHLWTADGTSNLEFSTRFFWDEYELLDECLRYALTNHTNVKLVVEPNIEVVAKVQTILHDLNEGEFDLSLLTISLT